MSTAAPRGDLTRDLETVRRKAKKYADEAGANRIKNRKLLLRIADLESENATLREAREPVAPTEPCPNCESLRVELRECVTTLRRLTGG